MNLPKIDLLKTDRKKWDSLANLFAIIVQVEHLEMIWARGCCSDEDYTHECKRLITRFKGSKTSVEPYYPDISKFFNEYTNDCHAARNRLLTVGVPATVFHGGSSKEVKNSQKLQLNVAQAVQYFITTIDGLQLSLKAVDEIHPHIKDLMESLNKIEDLGDHPSRKNVQKWLIKLNQMKAHDELSDEDIRQMTFDLENAYSEFVKFLRKGE